MNPVAMLAQAMGGAWTSGLSLYATCAGLGLLGRYGDVELAGNLTILESWWIIGPALALYVVEFFADKVPWLDSVWDVVHTFLRVPAGFLLAGSVYSESGPVVQAAASLAGAALAGETHALKAGARALINASPEPVTNWIASLAENITVIGALFFAVSNPALFTVFLGIAAVIGVLALRVVWKGVRSVFSRAADLFRCDKRWRAPLQAGSEPAS